jgi:hypothetical protein
MVKRLGPEFATLIDNSHGLTRRSALWLVAAALIEPSLSRVETPQEIGERLGRETAAIPQILRQRWIIFGEFVVSFTFTHIRTF